MIPTLTRKSFVPFRPAWSLGQAPVVSSVAPQLMTTSFTLDNAIVPQGIETGLILGLGGAALAALSGVLPDTVKPIGVVGGVLLAGAGVYKVFDFFFGNPVVEDVEIPAQRRSSLELVTGRVLLPPREGSAELSSMWGAVFNEAPRTYKIQFQINNPSPDDLILPIEFQVEEHKTILPDRVSRATYMVEVPGVGKAGGPAKEPTRKIVTGWQPVTAMLMGGISATGKLVLKGPVVAQDRVLDTVTFSI